MTNLLDGIRVIDWTQAHHGAATGMGAADAKLFAKEGIRVNSVHPGMTPPC